MKNKAKHIIAALLTLGLMVFVALLGFLLVLFFVWDVTKGTDGILSLLAFVVAAFILGYVMNKVINRIKRLWE